MMEIKLLTTRKKLTRSVLNQMRRATLTVLIKGEAIGFLNNVVKNTPRAILIRHEKDYYIISANYQKGDTSIYRRVGRATETITFKSTQGCDIWWEDYQHMIHSTISQIYI